MKHTSILSLVLLVSSLSAQAAYRLPSYVQECSEAALPKLQSQAQQQAAELPEGFQPAVCGIDARWYNPSKYVWFCADVKNRDGQEVHLQTLTQKSFLPLRQCF